MVRQLVLGGLAAVFLVAMAACATRTPPPSAVLLPPKYAEFVYPAVSVQGAPAGAAQGIERGWRFLQSDDLRSADREFAAILKRAPRYHPALTGTAYSRLARHNYREALQHFDAALEENPRYASALVGRGHTLLALDRVADALSSFEAALAIDSTLTNLRSRVEVLRFRALQDLIDRGRAAAKADRLEEARTAFQRALAASPDSAFLHRELAIVERRLGDLKQAKEHLQRAVTLDQSDIEALVQLASLLEEQKDFAAAEAAYRKAAELDPSPHLTARVAAASKAAREARLPREFQAIPGVAQLTRGDLAALIGVRLDDLLEGLPRRQVVMTDVRAHWANAWITRVAQTGVLEPFANHTFQPRAPVRRVDLAVAASRVLTVLAPPSARERWLKNRQKIADVGPRHLSYSSVSLAVASGVMPLVDGGRFQVSRPVTGAEAIEIVDRIRALVASR